MSVCTLSEITWTKMIVISGDMNFIESMVFSVNFVYTALYQNLKLCDGTRCDGILSILIIKFDKFFQELGLLKFISLHYGNTWEI